jgi:hypothetical protein
MNSRDGPIFNCWPWGALFLSTRLFGMTDRADLKSFEIHVLVELTDKCMRKTEYNLPTVT